MLDYQVCAELNDAGFPQDAAEWLNASEDNERYELAAMESDEILPHYRACPNSDELLAAIETRWPDSWGLTLTMVDYGPRDEQQGWEAAAAGSCGPYISEIAPTLVEALAALYVRLAASSVDAFGDAA